MRPRRHARTNLAMNRSASAPSSGRVEQADAAEWNRRDQSTHTTLRSSLYECEVMHHRLEPKEHHFKYRIFMFALDLDEIDKVAEKVLGFGRNRRSLYEFRDRDHLTLPELSDSGTVKEHLTAWL